MRGRKPFVEQAVESYVVGGADDWIVNGHIVSVKAKNLRLYRDLNCSPHHPD
jgi:hypothetical protein